MADELPPLPEKAGWAPSLGNQDIYTADQMRAYAQAAVLQERERLAKSFAYSLHPTTAVYPSPATQGQTP